MALASEEAPEERNRKLGGILVGVVLALIVIAVIRVLTHN